MNNNISKDELQILAYLHENAKGYGEQFRLVPGEVAAAMDVELDDFLKDASYLAEHGLVGMAYIDGSDNAGYYYIFQSIWLTGDGENFVRELENQPSIARKITTKTAGAIYDAGRTIIVEVLADFLSGRIR